jgi:sortase A
MPPIYFKKSDKRKMLPFFPLLLVFIGLMLLSWVGWPIISFKLFYNPQAQLIVTPLADDFVDSAKAEETDFTNASNWFPNQPKKATESRIDTYLMTIPKLRIKDAIVRIGTDDLSKNLIHYGGSGLPGQPGVAVIFGHSVLPVFYDPKNYMSIFSLLPTLKEKDDIYIRFDGVNYRYQVSDMHITTPDDVSGLEQRYDDSYIILVTCVPPGTYLQRLWLTARIVPYDAR